MWILICCEDRRNQTDTRPGVGFLSRFPARHHRLLLLQKVLSPFLSFHSRFLGPLSRSLPCNHWLQQLLNFFLLSLTPVNNCVQEAGCNTQRFLGHFLSAAGLGCKDGCCVHLGLISMVFHLFLPARSPEARSASKGYKEASREMSSPVYLDFSLDKKVGKTNERNNICEKKTDSPLIQNESVNHSLRC